MWKIILLELSCKKMCLNEVHFLAVWLINYWFQGDIYLFDILLCICRIYDNLFSIVMMLSRKMMEDGKIITQA